jgi:hypothetical protein
MRYFFDLHNDTETRDQEGAELPDMESAIAHARLEAKCMAAESVREFGHLILGHSITIRDVSGSVVGAVKFADVVRVRE